MIIAPLKGFAGLNTPSSLPLSDKQLIKNKVDKEQKWHFLVTSFAPCLKE